MYFQIIAFATFLIPLSFIPARAQFRDDQEKAEKSVSAFSGGSVCDARALTDTHDSYQLYESEAKTGDKVRLRESISTSSSVRFNSPFGAEFAVMSPIDIPRDTIGVILCTKKNTSVPPHATLNMSGDLSNYMVVRFPIKAGDKTKDVDVTFASARRIFIYLSVPK